MPHQPKEKRKKINLSFRDKKFFGSKGEKEKANSLNFSFMLIDLFFYFSSIKTNEKEFAFLFPLSFKQKKIDE